ncbi:MAG: Jag N-terminal domain-containing protein [Myxococcota bacterium]
MTETREFEGQTEDEAVSQACSALGLDAGQLDYTVLDEGSDGVLGLGKRPVQIRVRLPVEGSAEEEMNGSTQSAETVISESSEDARGVVGPAPEKAAAAKEVAENLAKHMGIACQVEVRDEDRQIVVLINEAEEGASDVAETLGRSRPPAIPSFQFLLNKIVNRFPDDRKHIVVEVPSVPRRERKSDDRRHGDGEDDLDPTLVELARMLADRATELGKVITIHPMVAGDRRAVHKTVMGIDGVQTVSEGEGLYRKMHIVPDALREDGDRKKRRRRRRRRPDAEERASGSSEAVEDEESLDSVGEEDNA